jgi:hypothetical protein
MSNFKKELEQLINKYSIDNESNTPDFILAEYLSNCLTTFYVAVKMRSTWHEEKKHLFQNELNENISNLEK